MKAVVSTNPLAEKEITAEKLMRDVVARPALIGTIIAATEAGSARERYLGLKTVSLLAVSSPQAVYPYFGVFARMLDHANRIYQWNALDILADLLAVDEEDRFGPIKASYLAKFREGNLITAAHVVENVPTIIRYRPSLEAELTGLLLEAETIPLPTAECRNILCGKVIQAFDRYFDRASAKKALLDFASRQTDNSRPATGAKARNFLKKRSL